MRGIKRRKNMAAAPVEANASAPGSPNEVPDQAGAAESAAAPVNGKAETAGSKFKTKEEELSFWELVFSQGDRWTTDGLQLYLYRVWPRIDRAEDFHYLTTAHEPLDEAWVREHYGSGRYTLMLKDKRRKLVRTHSFSIHDQAHPPRVDEAEVLHIPENDLYFSVWAKRKPNGVDRQSKAESAKGETAEILNAVFERGNKIDPQLIDLFKDASKQRDELATKLSERKQDMPPPSPPQPDVLGILTQVKSLQADPLAMLEKLKGFFPAESRKENNPPPQNSLDELKKVLDVFGQAKNLFTPEVSAPASVASPDADMWERIAVNLSTQIASIVNAAPAIITAFKLKPPTPGAAMPGAPTAPMATQTPFDPYRANPAEMRNFVQSQNPQSATSAPHAATGSPPAPPPPTTGTAAAAGQPDDAGLAQVIGLVNQALNCMNRQIDGHQAAAAVCDLNGELTYSSLVQQINAAGIPVVIELAKGIPELSVQVTAYEVQLLQFMTEFVEGPWDDEEDAESAQDAVSASV